MKTIRAASMMLMFALLTSAIVPEVVRLERMETPTEVVGVYQEPFIISKKKMDIEQIKAQIKIVLREIENYK